MLRDFTIRPLLPATDLARARSFYTETLGFEVLEEGPEWVRFESGGVEFGLYPTRAGAGPGTVAGWYVDDLDAEMRQLRDRGVGFEEYDLPGLKTADGVAELENVRAAWFRDSEGNVLGLVQELGSA